jgi:hypothetical protein
MWQVLVPETTLDGPQRGFLLAYLANRYLSLQNNI